jgi:tRNA threonylcarbamoyladenosine biosynthesis protein TsaE
MQLTVPNPEAMESLGRQLAGAASAGTQIHLSGELGAGKTTLVRGFLHGLGYQGKVKSPTYTLVEPYKLGPLSIFHFDFYRIKAPEEVELMGYREYPGADAICLIEWPDKAGDFLGEADLRVEFKHQPGGRSLEFSSFSQTGNSLISKISPDN